MNKRDSIINSKRRKFYTLYRDGIKVFTSYTTLMSCDSLDDLLIYTSYQYPHWFKEYLVSDFRMHRSTFTIEFYTQEEAIEILRFKDYYEPLYLQKHNMACKYGQKTHDVF